MHSRTHIDYELEEVLSKKARIDPFKKANKNPQSLTEVRKPQVPTRNLEAKIKSQTSSHNDNKLVSTRDEPKDAPSVNPKTSKPQSNKAFAHCDNPKDACSNHNEASLFSAFFGQQT